MAKLYFYYSAMNAGKSTTLLQSDYNYNERGMETILFTPKLDDRFEAGKIHSRIGLQAKAIAFTADFNLFTCVKNRIKTTSKLACVLIDEAQFLSPAQVEQLSDVVDILKIPVLAYGLRTDFLGNLFPGSQHLLGWADEISEIKTVCHCGKKAIMNVRVDKNGHAVTQGSQIFIGGNDTYLATCRRHFKQMQAESKLELSKAKATTTV